MPQLIGLIIVLAIAYGILMLIINYILPFMVNLLIISAVVGILIGSVLALYNYIRSFYGVMVKSE